MPRKKLPLEERPRPQHGGLVDRLADELRADRQSGQPLIYEQAFPTGAVRVVVLWDEWDRIPHEDRTAVILRAYERAEGAQARQQITLASGLTTPEAHAAGMLPVQIITGLRSGDPVTLDQCRQAMIAEGASTLLGPDRLQLRFATEEEAEACRERLTQRLPGSEPVWIVTQEVGLVADSPLGFEG
jgi:hypothetical protein